MKKLIFLLLLLFTFIGCNDDNDQEMLPLIIANYSPENGLVGDEVVILAENINTNISYTIKINDLVLDDILVTETTIKGRIPSGASTGELSIDYNETNIAVGLFEVKQPLLVTSYLPTSGYVGNEIIIQVENIETTTNYIIKVDGLIASNISVSDTELKARIPTGANSGNITIEYQNTDLLVGPFEVLETTDELLISSFITYPPKIYRLDMASGEIIENLAVFPGNANFQSYTKYNPRSNTMVSYILAGGGQLWGSYSAYILDIDTGIGYVLPLSEYVLGANTNFNHIGSIGDNDLFLNTFDENGNSKLIARDLDGQGDTILFDSTIRIGSVSGFIPTLNSYIGYYTETVNHQFYFKANLTNQTYTTSEIGTIHDKIIGLLITSEEDIYGLRFVNEGTQIVQIDPNTGEVILVIESVNERLKNLNFS